MSRFTPRKKKIQSTKVRGAQKLVRIDNRTQIMVDVSIPDDEARERYLTRLGKNVVYGFKPIGAAEVISEPLNGSELPYGSLEKLEHIIDEMEEAKEE